MPLYEYECEACEHRFERIQKFSDPPLDTCPKCGGARPQAAVVAGDSVQGLGLLHHRLREEVLGDGGQSGSSEKSGSSAEHEKTDKTPIRDRTKTDADPAASRTRQLLVERLAPPATTTKPEQAE